jgi:predicted nuclease of restriction endonuclease-like (RecB) superfamily
VERQGKALTNFAERLPKPRSDLARESLKDPYRFDFLGIGDEATELEGALVQHVTRFLLELGAGFAFVGRQVHLEVGGEDFFLDLLFYHLKLRAYVVIELKAIAFKPEHLGQLGFYLTAVDAQVKAPEDEPTIGLLLCKSKNKVVKSIHDRAKRAETGHILDDSWMTDELAKERGLDIEHDPWTRALWEATHQSFALRRWVSESKFGPHRVVCRTPLTNIRITTFFAGEHEVRVLDPSRVELLAAVGCEVNRED